MKLLKTPRSRAYLGLGVLAAGLVGLALSGDLLVHATWFTAFYVLAGAGFALLATAATSLPLRGAIVAAVVLRLIFLPVMPSLSDDYHRYVWDGRVQLAGINPYLYRPYEHALDRVRYAGRDRINHDELRTVYPPLDPGGLPRRGVGVPRPGARDDSDAARRGRALQARVRRVRPRDRGGHLVPRRRRGCVCRPRCCTCSVPR